MLRRTLFSLEDLCILSLEDEKIHCVLYVAIRERVSLVKIRRFAEEGTHARPRLVLGRVASLRACRRTHVRAHEAVILVDIEIDSGDGRLAPLVADVALSPPEARPLADAEVMLRDRPLLGPANELGHVLFVGLGSMAARIGEALPLRAPASAVRRVPPLSSHPLASANGRTCRALPGLLGRAHPAASDTADAAGAPRAPNLVARRVEEIGRAPALGRRLREAHRPGSIAPSATTLCPFL